MRRTKPKKTAKRKIAVDLSFVAVGAMNFTERNTGLALSVFVAPDGHTLAVAAHGADFLVKEACRWFAAQMCEQAPGGEATASKPETFKTDDGDAVTRVVVKVRPFKAPPAGVA